MVFKFFFQSMEFSSIWYSSFWSLLTVVSSAASKYFFHNATIPVSDGLEENLVDCFDILVTISISHAFLFRPSFEEHRRQVLKKAPSNKIFSHYLRCFAGLYAPLIGFALVAHFLILSPRNLWTILQGISALIISVGWWRVVLKLIILGFKNSQTRRNYFNGFAVPLRMFPYHNLFWVLFQGFWLLSLVVQESPVDWNLRIYGFYLATLLDMDFVLLNVRLEKKPIVAAYLNAVDRLTEIVCGTLVSTLAQYWFRVQSVPLMLGFWFWAMAWLGIIANVNLRNDLGLLQFFISMTLQSALSLFGLHFYTFLVVLGGTVLMLVKWKLEHVSLRHFGKQEIIAMDMKHWEELFEVIASGNNFGPYCKRYYLQIFSSNIDFHKEQPRITGEPRNSNI